MKFNRERVVKMGQQDLYQSDFYEDKSRFVDVFNGILFNGREIMKSEELENADSVMVSFQGQNAGKKVICDKIRKWKGKYVSIMVLENQSYVDYRMVLRVMESEVIGYDTQRKEAYSLQRKSKRKFDKHEYLSRMKKGQKFIPIITLVIYVGRDKLWDGEKSLYGMLEMDEDIKPFVNDFKLNLFDYHDYESFDMFKTENRFLFEMLSCGKNKKKMQSILKNNVAYSKLDKLTVKTISGILKLKIDLDKIVKTDKDGKEVYDMCKAFDDYKEEGRREIELEMVKMIKNLMRNQEVSFDVAIKMLGISKGRKKKLSRLM